MRFVCMCCDVISGRYIPSQWLQQGLQPIMASGELTPIPIVSRAGRLKAAVQLKEMRRITLRGGWNVFVGIKFC